MGDFQNQQVGAEQDDLQNRDAQPAAQEHPATAQVRAMLSSRDPKAIGEIIRNNPEAKAEIYKLLHQSLGNRFVTQVEQFASNDGARGKGGKFTSDELRNIIDGDGSALDKKSGDTAQASGNPNKFNQEELHNIIDGDGSALDKKKPDEKARARGAALEIEDYEAELKTPGKQPPGNPNKFSQEELHNIIDGDGSALDKKKPDDVAQAGPGNPNKFNQEELHNIIDGDGSALDKKKPDDVAQAGPGNPNKFSQEELHNIIDGDGSALDKKKPDDVAQAGPGNPNKFTSDELRNIIDGDGSALDKKKSDDVAQAGPAPSNPNKFNQEELHNIIDGDGSALDKKQAPKVLKDETVIGASNEVAQNQTTTKELLGPKAQGNPNKFTPDELRNIIDGDGSALDKKAAAPTSDLTSNELAPQDSKDAPKKPEAKWVTGARRYNRAHAAQVAEFLQATGNACVDEATGEADPHKVARWQADHGVAPDGRVGEHTITAAILDFHEPTAAPADGAPKSS